MRNMTLDNGQPQLPQVPTHPVTNAADRTRASLIERILSRIPKRLLTRPLDRGEAPVSDVHNKRFIANMLRPL
jgi:hypothetical protein